VGPGCQPQQEEKKKKKRRRRERAEFGPEGPRRREAHENFRPDDACFSFSFTWN
jgi:hypothetical protein